MKKTLKIVLLLLGCSLFLVGCKPAEKTSDEKKLEKIIFVLDWTPNTNHTGLYVAQQQGYYEEAGLEVEIIQPSEESATTLVASGKAAFGISAHDSLAANYASKEPMPVTAVAAVLQHNTSGIMSRKGDGIDTPKGLENKTYATWDSPVEQAMIAEVMVADNGDFAKVNLIPNNIVDEPMALKEKQADAIWVFYGWGGITAEIEDVPIDYFYFKDINPVFDYYTPVIIGNDQLLAEKPDLAKKFLAATAKGYQFAATSPAKAAEILVEAVPELDAELVSKSQAWLADQYLLADGSWGYIEAKRWNDFYNWLGEKEIIENKIPENTGFTNEYLPE
ncbi:ABC-type nitrate/sulfonate/bicarbonate transport system substrate-binding protein [Enterococcus sp. PF1-24]|uniref:ABC transporter substrate-binding protein n=1 Tax=unclassified Enterococcus TaxID=2608891 RepID=UPI002474B64B|nr:MULTISPECIES: ABC transporter substrate-binding protein [unclassified Enterococcus]MDH6365573.1 ABC-type nitrate/sulfonate/bicarbonate transport system substrate-binding protein [Enterococcus sp. PFB1-1]MDH6402675.1 ABC-type nitrate/sulfonate/bicarbonate transport system substrate-binding protein [Enterococcus sp. PF1-24]